MTTQNVQITQYGLSKKAGGWDGAGDSGTDNWLGNHGNRLNGCSCALSPEFAHAIGAVNGDLLLIEFSTGLKLVKAFDDLTTPGLTNFRLDVFNPYHFDNVQDAAGQFATVTLYPRARQI